MAAKVIMPALGMAQEFGKLIAWLKQEGDDVSKGEPLIEIETDKATVEFDAQASGVLAGIRAVPGQEVPVGEVIAWILQPGEEIPEQEPIVPIVEQGELPHVPNEQPEAAISNGSVGAGIQAPLEISPVARNIAMEHGIDLNQIKVNGNRVQKADVLRYIEEAKKPEFAGSRLLASPKARRLAAEQGISLGLIIGSGPDGAVLAEDVMGYATADNASLRTPGGRSAAQLTGEFEMSKAWEVMAGR
ncbi:MAG: E3 binding domain-containing protein, partial [Anaerolineae bacterium]|nr:E3 binding domain-containing protein [Anaerolineae bacterium]